MVETELNRYWVQYINDQIANATQYEKEYAAKWNWRTARDIITSRHHLNKIDLKDGTLLWSLRHVRLNFQTWLFSSLINHEGPHRKDVWLAYIKIQDGSGLDQNDDKILIEFLSNEESIS